MLLEISQNSQENTCARVSFLIKLQACNFIKKVPQTCNFIKKRGFGTGVFLLIAKFLRAPILTEHLRWLLLIVSRNLKLEERTDQNFVTQNLLHGRNIAFQRKRNCLSNAKRRLHMNIFWLWRAGWLSIFWEVLGSDGCILACGG